MKKWHIFKHIFNYISKLRIKKGRGGVKKSVPPLFIAPVPKKSPEGKFAGSIRGVPWKC